MSRNFELLQKLGKEQDLINAVPIPAPVNGNHAESATVAPAAASDFTAAVPVTATSATSAPAFGDSQPEMEEINSLVQQLFMAAGADAPRTVVFASTEPGSGCTWVCAHVAEVLASRVAGRVCVVDANLRDPGLHTQFGVENQIGLSDALSQLDPIRAFARPLSRPNLWLISSGLSGDASLTSDRMRLRIAELRTECDFILIDVAAMSLGNDAVGVGNLADGVVLVLKANSSRREAARQAVQDLQGGKTKVLGAVLNQRTYPIPPKIYNKF
jgi:Mrp family chromosome partitioning ATPase